MKPHHKFLAYSFVIVAAIGAFALASTYLAERDKERLAERLEAPVVPEIIVLSNYDVGTLHGTAFYVKSTDSVCHLTTNSVLVNGALDCNPATAAQRQAAIEALNKL